MPAWLTLLMAVIDHLTPVLVALIGARIYQRQGKFAERAEHRAMDVKIELVAQTAKTNEGIAEIHTMVNSDRTLMATNLEKTHQQLEEQNAQLAALRAQVATLTHDKSRLEATVAETSSNPINEDHYEKPDPADG